ncbi:MAG: hypothetical protein J4445_00255 [DPANN group archaeon]|nr:hypothetical protein [DPANN group archaeon]
MKTLRNKGQSYAEYIIAIFLFIGILIFLFSSIFVRTQQESTAIDEQTNCGKANAIADSLLKSCGNPPNWDTVGTVTRIGLTNCTDYIVTQYKWGKAKAQLKANNTYIGVPIGNVSWRISYEGYAFSKVSDASGLGTCDDVKVFNKTGVVICRSGGNTTQIHVNSTSPGIAYLLLYFPNITAGAGGITMATDSSANTESNDQAIASNVDNGTLLELILRTDKSDRDTPKIHRLSGGSFPKTFTYFENYYFESRTNKDLPFYLGNTSLRDSIGPKPLNPSGLCKVQRGGEIVMMKDINTRIDSFPVRFTIEAWS